LGISAGALFVFAVILVALVLFATERGLSGSASAATLTVLAMFVLSDGVQRTGVVRIPGRKVASLTGNSEGRQLGATIGLVILVAVILLLTSLCYLWIQTLSAWILNSSFHVLTATSISHISEFINNTAAVAILLPMVTNLAHEGETSPSKLLMALSYAPTFGGMLTLIGTSTNILASELSGRLIGRTFTMFEFTQLGIIVSVVGTVYLLTVGRYLTPASPSRGTSRRSSRWASTSPRSWSARTPRSWAGRSGRRSETPTSTSTSSS
jgi:di/tricarboxylate transporter